MIIIDNILHVEKFINSVSAVVFDLDDTLYPEKDYVKSGFKAISELFPEFHSMFTDLWQSFLKGEKAIDTVFKRYGISQFKEKAVLKYRSHFPNINPYPGVTEMLAKIKETKKTGIITDGRPEGQHAKIKALGLEPFFDSIIITDECGGIKFRKPNPTAYKITAKALSADFNEMCYIGDNILKDFTDPVLLEMKSIFFRNSDGLYYRTL